MSEQHVFLALPEDLYAEAREVARLRQVSLSDLLIEALSESIEAQQRSGWVAERTPLACKRSLRIQ